jgi:hypothetical protein
VLASRADGTLFVDTLKNNRARTVPLVADLVPIVAGWAAGKRPADWLFAAPAGGPLSEANWKRSVGWTKAIAAVGMPDLRVHDLRHTAASVWLGAGADPKVVQRILGHASAAMTMDLYGHLIDHNLWDAAKRIDELSQNGGTGRVCGPGFDQLNQRQRTSDQRFCIRAGDRSRTRDILITRSIRAPGRRSRNPLLSVNRAVR